MTSAPPPPSVQEQPQPEPQPQPSPSRRRPLGGEEDEDDEAGGGVGEQEQHEHHQGHHHHDQHHQHQKHQAQPQQQQQRPFDLIPPPWHVTGDVYCVSFWSHRAVLPPNAYSPLEAGADFAKPEAGGRPAGGLGMIQLIRYHDSPVGPYDEMLVVPGSFDWTRPGPGGRRQRGRNPRISRMYVSQKQSCYNGRINWGCPKHLARFDWSATGPNGAVSVKVYPHDTSGDASESAPSPRPLFQASFAPVAYAPAFPFATRWLGYLGFNTTIVMPPLPEGPASRGELPGTDRWLSFVPSQYSRNTRLGWFDMAQPASGEGPHDSFWPGLGRWQLGLKMENARVVFENPLETWAAAAEQQQQQPQSKL